MKTLLLSMGLIGNIAPTTSQIQNYITHNNIAIPSSGKIEKDNIEDLNEIREIAIYSVPFGDGWEKKYIQECS